MTTKTILKNSYGEVVYKLSGAGSTTIALNNSDVLAHGQKISAIAGNDPKVDITGISFTGDAASVISIKRNNVVIATGLGSASNYIDLGGQGMPPDTTNNTYPVVVDITGQGELWLRLRKTTGYELVNDNGQSA